MHTIAFAGLGAMGLPMAKNLLVAGHRVRGFDLNPVALTALASAGGEASSDAVAAAQGADVMILMVVNAAQAEQVLFDSGALQAMPDDGIVCLMATCPPATVERIATRVMAAGRRFVDAPVSGGTAGAGAASLTVMAACERSTFEAALVDFVGLELEVDGELVRGRVQAEGDEGAERLFEAVAKAGIVLRELSAEATSLEDVFAALTTEEEDAA